MAKVYDNEASEEQAKEDMHEDRKVRQERQQRQQDGKDQPEVDYPTLAAQLIVHSEPFAPVKHTSECGRVARSSAS
jgi:hypothetical protein